MKVRYNLKALRQIRRTGKEEPLDSIELARAAVDAIAETQGLDIVILDIRDISLLADYFVICTAHVERQARAIREELVQRLKAQDVQPLGVEGAAAGGWVVLDYGTVIVHIFTPTEREYYQLEGLWNDASVVMKMP
ncbi:MAG: ribosome silencing factor [Chloroflexota bacterium]|nr:ribosome silencing factor [Chloroflexota bacterium]